MQDHIRLALELFNFSDKSLEWASTSEEVSLEVRRYFVRLKTLQNVAKLYGKYDLNQAKGKIELRQTESKPDALILDEQKRLFSRGLMPQYHIKPEKE